MTVTRRHHPLQGKTFDVLAGGNERITIRLADGTSMRIPRIWTDADGAPSGGHKIRQSFFTVESLRRLIELVDAFLKR